MAPSKENVSVEDAPPFECPACGHEWAVTIGPTHGGHYRRCLECGLEIRIISDAESISESFGTAQNALYGDDEVLNPPSLRRVQHQLASARLRIIRQYLPSGRLLEVGPGAGALLALAQSKGYHVAAIEHSPALANQLSEELGIQVACGMVEEMGSAGQPYDGVVSMHVIEHVPDPLKHVVAARAAVAIGGYLFLATPNLESWTRRLAGNHCLVSEEVVSHRHVHPNEAVHVNVVTLRHVGKLSRLAAIGRHMATLAGFTLLICRTL